MIKYITIIILFITLCSFIQCGKFSPVLLKDVSVLTLTEGKTTAHRRVEGISQLECIGGSARSEYSLRPRVVQCKNVGWDGVDVQWECTANLDLAVKLGKIDVSCEGYDFPDDPYILSGSCGLRYELEYTDPVKRNAYYEQYKTEDIIGYIILFVVVCVFIWAIFGSSTGSGQQYQQQQQVPGYDGGYPPQPPYGPGNYGNGYGNGPYYPNPYAPNAPPPPTGCAVPPQQGWRPGFWSGAGLGYLFGRGTGSRNYSNNGYTNNYSTPSRSSYSSGSRSTGISSSSSSFGGTSRR